MKVAIYPIVSSLHEKSVIDSQTFAFINELKLWGEFDFVISSLEEMYNSDLALILVQSGGSEGMFLSLKEHFQEPYYLLTYGTNNSLAASMEILSYLKSNHEAAEIFHGSTEDIAARLTELGNIKKEEPVNLGIIGKPSDWLIASKVDKFRCLEKLNINLIDIDMLEFTDLYQLAKETDFSHNDVLLYDEVELNYAKKVSVSLEKLIKKYNLKGLTIRCFDLLGSIHTTGCLGLALINKNGLVGTCEGDVPAMISMYLLNKITGQSGFQANPARIDSKTRQIVLAHCTIPLDMATQYSLTTHYESGIGVAIKGKLKESVITIFKLSNDLLHYYVEEGKIIENLDEANLCRTQIKVQLPDIRYFLTSPFGNHHIVVYGAHKQKIKDYLDKLL